MESLNSQIQFIQALIDSKILLDLDNTLNQVLDNLKILKREYTSANETYLVEIPLHKYKAWLQFQANYQAPSRVSTAKVILPNFSAASIQTIKTAAL